jgi:hypothetical protein
VQRANQNHSLLLVLGQTHRNRYFRCALTQSLARFRATLHNDQLDMERIEILGWTNIEH